jgi:hypothetical protein
MPRIQLSRQVMRAGTLLACFLSASGFAQRTWSADIVTSSGYNSARTMRAMLLLLALLLSAAAQHGLLRKEAVGAFG